MKRVISFTLLLLVVCTSCSPKKVRLSLGEKTICLNLAWEPNSLDPRKAHDIAEKALARMLFEGLTRIGPDKKPQLALAESVAISEDKKTYTFHLRSAQWTNQKPILSSDFLQSWKEVIDPSSCFHDADLLYVIKNAEGVKKGKIPLEQLGISIPDERTLVIKLEHPSPSFLSLLANAVFFPVYQTDEKTAVGSGPFSFVEWKHSDTISVKKNPSYWDVGSVALDGVKFVIVDEDTEIQLFEKGTIQWAGSPLSTLSVDAIKHFSQKKMLHIQPVAATRYLRVNVQDPTLVSPKFRRALALSIDREAIVTHVTQGGQSPAMRFVPLSLCEGGDALFRDNDVQRARELLEEALDEMGISRDEMPPLVLTYAQAQRTHLTAQVLQQQWLSNLGIKVELQCVEAKVYYDMVARSCYQIALSSTFADIADPVNLLSRFRSKDEVSNQTNWEDSEYRGLFQKALSEGDEKRRQQLLDACERILIGAMPVIPIYHYTMVYMKDPKLQGVTISDLGELDFKWARLENAE